MQFKISHELHYEYDRPVFFDPHTFYLRPREDGAHAIKDFNLQISPAPTLQTWSTDFFGNTALRVWFREKYDHLNIVAQSRVESLLQNPFNYFPEDSCEDIPVAYPSSLGIYLNPYVNKRDEIFSLAVRHYTEHVAVQCGSQTISFLPALCHSIFLEFERVTRPTGPCQSPMDTLSQKRGACRDLAVLFIACCESQNFAARFVSGYFEGDCEITEKNLHAWAEVYVEGGGWRGFDPSTGLAVDESYVPLAASPVPELVSPCIGSFRGNQVKIKFNASIQMQAFSSAQNV